MGEPLGWRSVATGASGAQITWCASRAPAGGCDVRREGQLLLGRNRTLLLGVAPRGHNAGGVATVGLDYAEAKIRYRLPAPGL